MSSLTLKESDGDERCNWLKGEEDDDAESAHTTSEEDPIVVPPTPVEYGESGNLDQVIQRKDELRILRLREYRALLSIYHRRLSRE